MFNYKKIIRFCESNVVLMVGVPLIIGVHWCWYRLQQDPALVRPEDRKDLPIIIGARALKDYVMDGISFGGATEKKTSEKSN